MRARDGLGSDTGELIERERQLLTAVFSRDRRVMTELMASDGLGVDATMGCVSQRSLIDGIDALADGASFVIEQARVVHADDDVAVLAYRLEQHGHFDGAPLPSAVHCTSVWSRNAGAWKAVFHHETAARAPA